MAIFRECKHSFRIVQALFGKSASTLVFSTAKVRISPESLRTMFAGAKVRNRIGSFGTNHELHEFHEFRIAWAEPAHP